jgi:hypothetical protein
VKKETRYRSWHDINSDFRACALRWLHIVPIRTTLSPLSHRCVKSSVAYFIHKMATNSGATRQGEYRSLFNLCFILHLTTTFTTYLIPLTPSSAMELYLHSTNTSLWSGAYSFTLCLMRLGRTSEPLSNTGPVLRSFITTFTSSENYECPVVELDLWRLRARPHT